LQKFADLVKERSDGRINIEIFPSAQLGNERDLVEGLTMGTIDMALSNSGNLAAFTDSYQVFDLPFLFRDYEHAHKVLDGEIGQKALASLDDIGIKGLANWENGFFNTWNSKRPINGPEDFKGLKIRANDNPIHITAYDAFGASAVTMGWSEVYTAIQNGTVDGVAVSIPSMYTAKIYEVAPYISTSGEFYVTAILMMNKKLFDGMPEDLQTVLIETAKEVTEYQRETNEQMEADFIEDLKAKGFEVTHPDREALKAATWQPVYDKFAEQLGKDIIESIQNDY
jgi:tripartite ATP-independent transporter DctP family solute receptor